MTSDPRPVPGRQDGNHPGGKPQPDQPPEKPDRPDRGKAISDAVARHRRDHGNRPVDVETPYGRVAITSLAVLTLADGTPYVEVDTAGGDGDSPHYRIFNPPTLVADPTGDITIDGSRYRTDPVAAVASAIARHATNAGRPR